jgi:hypothetical protein
LLTRFHAEIITPFHVLNQAHATGLLVAPGGSTARTLGQGSNGLVPLPSALNGLTLEVVTSWETKEFLKSQHVGIPGLLLSWQDLRVPGLAKIASDHGACHSDGYSRWEGTS